MRPGRALGADLTIADKVDQASNGGQHTHDEANGYQPGRKVRPHHVSARGIGDVGDQGTGKTNDGDRHQHRVDRMPCNLSG
jgi:hypothetical protein